MKVASVLVSLFVIISALPGAADASTKRRPKPASYPLHAPSFSRLALGADSPFLGAEVLFAGQPAAKKPGGKKATAPTLSIDHPEDGEDEQKDMTVLHADGLTSDDFSFGMLMGFVWHPLEFPTMYTGKLVQKPASGNSWQWKIDFDQNIPHKNGYVCRVDWMQGPLYLSKSVSFDLVANKAHSSKPEKTHAAAAQTEGDFLEIVRPSRDIVDVPRNVPFVARGVAYREADHVYGFLYPDSNAEGKFPLMGKVEQRGDSWTITFAPELLQFFVNPGDYYLIVRNHSGRDAHKRKITFIR